MYPLVKGRGLANGADLKRFTNLCTKQLFTSEDFHRPGESPKPNRCLILLVHDLLKVLIDLINRKKASYKHEFYMRRLAESMAALAPW